MNRLQFGAVAIIFGLASTGNGHIVTDAAELAAGVDLSRFADAQASTVLASSGGGYTPVHDRERPYAPAITEAGNRHGIDPALLAALCQIESNYRNDIITGATKSHAGAIGICQFMPPTARAMGVDPLNPASAFDGAARYLANSHKIHGTGEKRSPRTTRETPRSPGGGSPPPTGPTSMT